MVRRLVRIALIVVSCFLLDKFKFYKCSYRKIDLRIYYTIHKFDCIWHLSQNDTRPCLTYISFKPISSFKLAYPTMSKSDNQPQIHKIIPCQFQFHHHAPATFVSVTISVCIVGTPRVRKKLQPKPKQSPCGHGPRSRSFWLLHHCFRMIATLGQSPNNRQDNTQHTPTFRLTLITGFTVGSGAVIATLTQTHHHTGRTDE